MNGGRRAGLGPEVPPNLPPPFLLPSFPRSGQPLSCMVMGVFIVKKTDGRNENEERSRKRQGNISFPVNPPTRSNNG